MAKKEKHTTIVKYEDLKARFKSGKMEIEEIDRITCELIAELAVLTDKNFTEISGIPIDLMKDRVWWLIEKAGLLPEYRDEDEDLVSDEEDEDDYYKVEDDEFEIDDSKFYQ